MEEAVKTDKNKYFWIIGGIVFLLAGVFGWKMIFGEGDYKVTLVNAPQESVAGSNVTFTWRVDGPSTTINHTSVHYSTISTPGILEKTVKPGDTQYTDLVKDFASGQFTIPLQFIGNTVIAAPGKYYFRVHALVKDKNYWSEEYTLDVKSTGDYQISIINAPKEVTAGSIATFTWDIYGVPTAINHTAIHFGDKSNPGILDYTVKPGDTSYTDFVKDFASGKYDIPFRFVGNVQIATPGAYFYRAHTDINGRNLWTDEATFEVK